jgi:hypothetical protein
MVADRRIPNQADTDLGVVVTYSEGAPNGGHEHITRTEIARRLAALMGYDFAGEYQPSARYRGAMYFVPSDTLVGVERARRLGIRSERDLFGGVVPYPFVAMKTITHPLVDRAARAPDGWSPAFCEEVENAVLPGFAAFEIEDARRAGARLLERGRVRVKRSRGVGGRGQVVVAELAELESTLARLDTAELSRYGVVVEEDLAQVKTYSVGQVQVAGLLATYHGTQCLTTNNRGATVYGGSSLVLVRGDFDALLRLDLAPEVRLAIAQARVYDAAAMKHFPGFLASRRNYDVVQGLDAQGKARSGVLEQSWRIGGASSAEIAALEAFRADPKLATVCASCKEIYGAAAAPPHAVVYFRGVDETVGPITKYTSLES